MHWINSIISKSTCMNSFFIILCTILQRAGSYNSEVGEDSHLSKTDNLVCSNKIKILDMA